MSVVPAVIASDVSDRPAPLPTMPVLILPDELVPPVTLPDLDLPYPAIELVGVDGSAAS